MIMKVEDFVRDYPVRRFDRNQTVLLKGDTPETVFAIKSGFVKGYDIDAIGNEQLIWLGAKGDVFPVAWVLALQDEVDYFYSAFSDVEVYAIERQALLDFLRTSHSALFEVTKRLTTRLADALRHLNAAEKARAEEKILHTLYFLSLRFGHLENGDETRREITLPITHQDIANLLGLTRETVTVELKKLKDQHVIDYDKSRFIVHQDKLEKLL
jgi:CRP/FNR family cyclic AMP-dependent transcriptional regulator